MKYKIAVFPGDGVGPELISEGMRVLEKSAELGKFDIEWAKYPYGAEHYLETKEALSEGKLKEIKSSCSAIYCGTFNNSQNAGFIGKGISGSIKTYFDQCISLRPVKLLPGIESPLSGKSCNEIDFAVIRETTEDFYAGRGEIARNGKNKHSIDIRKGAFRIKFGLDIEAKGSETAYQISILSRKGCERAIRYAFEYAKRKNKKKVVSVDKANITNYYNLWRETANKIAKEYPEVECELSLIDAAVMDIVRQPENFEVIIAPNLFGDILSDLGTVIQGGLAFAAQGNISPDGISMFEPIHGSAPKLKGLGIVNPVATIWAGALMLDTIGQQKSADLIIKAMGSVLKEGRTRTQDLGGSNTTSEMGDAIVDRFIELHD